MRTSNLLILGTALLLLAPAAWAEDGAAPAAAVTEAEESAPQGAVADEGVDAWESAAAAEAESAGMAAESAPAEAAPAAEAVAELAEPAADADPTQAVAEPDPAATVEAVAETAPEDAATLPPAEVPAAEPSSDILLGAVGYDSEGRPGRIHVVRGGDTLWFISDAYLGTPWVWPSIWQDNQDIENPHLIFPGDHIWITPSEMRKVTPQEAEALLAGAPAEPELSEPADLGLDDVMVPGPADLAIGSEQPKLRLSDRERVGLISAEDVHAAAGILANVSPPLMISQDDRIYVGLGAGDAVEGDEFTVLRVGSQVFDPETGERLGYHVEFLGWIEVLEVDAEASLAVVRESASEMAIGNKLIARREPVSEIPLVSSPSGVEGQISYLPNSRTEMGMLDYVYLNRGTLDGVEVGSPLHVYRKGFAARDTVGGGKRQIPDRVVAELVVVRSEPEASVAFVRHTQEELTRGDYFRGVD